MEYYGVIDIGSNTEVLVIYAAEGDAFRCIEYISVPVHLIRYHKDGRMQEEGIRLTRETAAGFLEVCAKYENCRVMAEITEPWRGINNADELVKAVEDCGVSVVCLSGEEEAACDLAGASLSCPDIRLLIDIGGGSTEFVSCEDGAVRDMVSIPYGCLRLEALGYDAVQSEELLRDMRKEHPLLKDSRVLTGVGGTLRAVGIFMKQRTGKDVIDTEDLYALYEEILAGNEDTLAQVYAAVTEDRRPYIVPGCGMLAAAARIFHAEQIIVSPYGVREGFFLRHLRKQS